MKAYLNISLAIIFALTFSVARAQDSLNVSKVTELYNFWSGANDIYVHEDYAFCADVGYGLRIIDLSNLPEFEEVSNLECEAGSWFVAGNDVYLFTATWNNPTITIVDITTPEQPVIVDEYNCSYDIRDMTCENDMLFLSCEEDGFRILDISNINNVYEIGSCSSGNYIYSTDVVGDTAYLVGFEGLYIFDISNPSSPVELGNQQFIYGTDIKVQGDYAYLVGDMMEIVNISDPSYITFEAYVGTSCYPYSIDIKDNYAYVGGHFWCSSWYPGVSVVDISNPSLANEVGYCQLRGNVNKVSVLDDYVLAASSGIRLIDCSNPASPFEAAHSENVGFCELMAKSDQYLYLMDTFGLRVVDISMPENPLEISKLDINEYISDVVTYEQTIYALTYNYWDERTVQIIDMSDPYNPTIAGIIDSLYCSDIEVGNELLFLCDYSSGLRIYSIEDPLNPVEIGLSNQNTGNCIAVSGNIVFYYLVESTGMIKTIDVTNPSNPVQLSVTFCSDHLQKMEVSDDYLFAADHDNNLYIWDIADPANLQSIDTLNLASYIWDLNAVGDYLFVSGGGYTMQILDLKNISSITTTGYYDQPGGGYGTEVVGDYAYSGEGYHLSVYDCSEAMSIESPYIQETPIIFKLYPPYPNPFNPSTTISFDLPEAGNVSLKVYDIAGREVAKLMNGYQNAGNHEVIFDAEGLTSGVYFVRLEAGGFRQTKKILLIK